MKGRLPDNPTLYGYSIYLCAGMLAWNFFNELFIRSQNLYLEHANLLKKAAFPHSALSIINLIAASINWCLGLVLLLLFLLIDAAFPGGRLLWLIPVWLALTGLSLGMGLSIAILQVFFRDFSTLTTLLLQALFWSTPIVYTSSILPDWMGFWLDVNPLFAPVAMVQAIFLGSALPPLTAWGATLVAVVLSLLFAGNLLRRHKTELLDAI